MNVIVSSIVLLLVVGLNYGCTKLAIKNPSLISGFKMSEDAGQRELDKKWLRLLANYMRRANIVTLIGGLTGIVTGLQLVYILFLIVPISLAAVLAYSRRNSAAAKIQAAVTVTTLLAISIMVFYVYRSDLNVDFSDGKMEISGLYGRDIAICDISEAELCESLPEISIRTNGFALDGTRLGHFRTAEGKSIILFTHSDKYFVRITLTDGTTYYMSCKDKQATQQLLTEIKKELSGCCPTMK